MIFQKTLALFALTSADAFTFTSTSRGSIAVPKTNPQSFTTNAYTKLYAEESEESEEAAESPEENAEEEALDEAPPSGENDILNSPAFLKRKLDVLKSDIESVEGRISEANDVYEANKAEWGPQIDKLREEYSNISDRLDRQSKAGEPAAAKEVASALLPVLDNYDRAFKAVGAETDEEKEIEAEYKNVYDKIISTFSDMGVKEVETVGAEFDYEYHQAVMMRPDEDYEEGIVCEELQKGWVMEEGLIRPAMVVVAQ